MDDLRQLTRDDLFVQGAEQSLSDAPESGPHIETNSNNSIGCIDIPAYSWSIFVDC